MAKASAAKAVKGPVKKAGTAVQKWDEALAARAKLANRVASNLGTGSNFISFQGGIMSYKGNPVDGNSMDIIVPSFLLENQYYEGPFDPDNPQSPKCYAFGTDPDEMKPHEKSHEPQHETCKGCPHNEWGSAEQGKGKACKNVVRLGVLPASAADGGAQGIKDAEDAIAKLPVTSGKAWGGYVKSLEAVNLPPLAFITEMTEGPDKKTQFKISFQAKEQISDGEVLGALLARADIMDKTLATPYPDFEESAPAKRPGKAGKAGKAASKAPAKAATAAGRKAMVEAATAGKKPTRKF